MRHNKIIMDKKKAFKILNLHDSACFDEAKKAYRQLAKKFHPDMDRTHTGSPIRKRDSKMKEINLAFCYLAPFLRAKKESKSPPESLKNLRTHAKQNKKRENNTFQKKDKPVLQNIFETFSKIFVNNNHSKTLKKKNPVKKSNNRLSVFEDILKNVHQSPESYNTNPKKVTNSYKIKKSDKYKKNTYNAYQEYMILKKKMNNKQSRSNPAMSVGKVEKIEPVRPVNPVGSD